MKYRNNMRDIKYIMVHCTDTCEGREVTAEEVDRWHRMRGFEMIGYHYLIRLDGTVEHGRPLFMKGAACPKGGANAQGIHVCYVGGRNLHGETVDTRTEAQLLSMLKLITELRRQFPQAKVVGHRDFDRGKACPCFDAKSYNLPIV
jgi:N-acetylmuramoyl-L-alanine amidase